MNLVEELRSKKSRDNRDLLDRAADEIEDLERNLLAAYKKIEELESKQSEGEWSTIPQEFYLGPTEWVCSNCKEEFCIQDMMIDEFLKMMKHCPNCGAKMKGGAE